MSYKDKVRAAREWAEAVDERLDALATAMQVASEVDLRGSRAVLTACQTLLDDALQIHNDMMNCLATDDEATGSYIHLGEQQ